ncbi:MAG: alpha/beta hydrolase [Clostridia bacterium]
MSGKIKKILVIVLAVILGLQILPFLIPLYGGGEMEILPFDDSGRISLDDVSIHYIYRPSEGSGLKAGNILLVHGMGGSTFSWRSQVGALAGSGYDVVAVDLPGFGYSSRDAGFDHSQSNRAELLWEFLDAFMAEQGVGSDEEWILAGHSMGGGTITEMALQDSRRTQAIVYVDAAVISSTNRGVAIMEYPPAVRWIQVGLRYLFLREPRLKSFLESAYGREPTDEETAGYSRPLMISKTEKTLVDMVRTSTSTTRESLWTLNDTRIPVLSIWGGQDAWVPVDDAYALRFILNSMTLEIIEDAGHCPMETHPAPFNQILLDWLLGTR